jgi:hypothetical protein
MDKKERESQLLDELREGKDAKNLANNPIWKSVIEELETYYISSIRSGSWFKKRAREENCRRLQVLDDLVTVINNKITTGEEAQKRLEANKNGSKQRR